MNRTVRLRLVAVPWSLFPKELSVGQVLSLSLLWSGHVILLKKRTHKYILILVNFNIIFRVH